MWRCAVGHVVSRQAARRPNAPSSSAHLCIVEDAADGVWPKLHLGALQLQHKAERTGQQGDWHIDTALDEVHARRLTHETSCLVKQGAREHVGMRADRQAGSVHTLVQEAGRCKPHEHIASAPVCASSNHTCA